MSSHFNSYHRRSAAVLTNLRVGISRDKIDAMTMLTRSLACLRIMIVAALVWSVTALPLMAAAPQGAPVDTGKNWVIPYTLVVLAIALGLVIVCRSANRSKEVRHTELDDD